jgi:crotonobetainyl-CoA:carnitine CoA-transferase CaiB-like acyl-CoA transferase
MLLADLGAEVIKIEPRDGDISRYVGPHHVGPHNVYFSSLNRNKKSVQIELTTAEGQAQLGRLVATADALLVNLRPATIRKLGLDYASLRRWNEKIVCVALTGFGLEGRAAERPAFDYVIQALTGVAMLTGEPGGPPALAGYSAVDNSSGIMAALALLARIIEGRGGQVDVSLYDTMLSQLNYKAAAYLNGGERPERLPMGAHLYYVPAQLFETRDGYLAMFITHDEFWRSFATEVGRPEWISDARFATMQARRQNRELVIEAISTLLRSEDTKRWVERLAPLGIVISEVISLPEALDGEIAREREMLASIETPQGTLRGVGCPIHFLDSSSRYERPPLLGEHTRELLGECEPE